MSSPIATLRKNVREELRISIDEFHGHKLINLRVWFEADNGEMRPGRQGIALRLALLPELIAALSAVEGADDG